MSGSISLVRPFSGPPLISAVTWHESSVTGSTRRTTRMGKVDWTVSISIIEGGSYLVTAKVEITSRPRNLALCSYVDPTPVGGSEVQLHDSMPSCHKGLLVGSEKNANTISTGRSMTRLAVSSMNATYLDIVAGMSVSTGVDSWFDEYDHPAKDAMLRVREIILEDERMTETIKWKSPTFMYEGNMASFNPRTKAHVSLMFHTGASIPGSFALLEGGGETARYARFQDMADVEAKASQLRDVVAAWCESR